MKRIYELFDKIEYVPENMKKEMFDTIVGEIKDTIDYYSKPKEICIELLKKNKDKRKIINDVCKYLTDGSWFCKQPMLIEKPYRTSDFFSDMINYEDKDQLIVKIDEAFSSIATQDVDISKPYYIYIDGFDDLWIKNEDDFIEWLIYILDEEGNVQGSDMNKTYTDIIKIIKES